MKKDENEMGLNDNNRLLSIISDFVNIIQLDDVQTSYDSKTGTASIIGHKDGIRYTTTLSMEDNGAPQNNIKPSKEMGKDALCKQIKSLKKGGYKQSEIAKMLGVSQPTVSNYLRK